MASVPAGLFRVGSTRYRMLTGDRYAGIPQSLAEKMSKAYGLPVVSITEDEDAALQKFAPEG